MKPEKPLQKCWGFFCVSRNNSSREEIGEENLKRFIERKIA
jgi:hypothetical protein